MNAKKVPTTGFNVVLTLSEEEAHALRSFIGGSTASDILRITESGDREIVRLIQNDIFGPLADLLDAS